MSEALIDRQERVFQVWAYSVGMGRLLLRSTKNETFATRVDVLFQNVKAISTPTTLKGLIVRPAAPRLVRIITDETGLLPDDETSFFELQTHRGGGYIVAGVVVETEDHGEYFAPSKYWPEPT